MPRDSAPRSIEVDGVAYHIPKYVYFIANAGATRSNQSRWLAGNKADKKPFSCLEFGIRGAYDLAVAHAKKVQPKSDARKYIGRQRVCLQSLVNLKAAVTIEPVTEGSKFKILLIGKIGSAFVLDDDGKPVTYCSLEKVEVFLNNNGVAGLLQPLKPTI